MIQIPFDTTYTTLPDVLFRRQTPEPSPAPELLFYNKSLAADLGITGGFDPVALAEVFSGNHLPQGADPIAQLYAGHQFGHWVAQLGDGRAVLLGEVAPNGGRFDIALKGSGRTSFSRNGDGRAGLGPVLREYILSEAMHALGIPTTRALAVVATGARVQRERALPGAVLTRVAQSHIRVGTFQAAAMLGPAPLRALFNHSCQRHMGAAATPLEFLDHVIEAQARLVAKWMGVGFIHGVMNTDNCSISGETIDYGPCAFMDEYHPLTCFSSIDKMGRYAYARQADIIVWNMAMLANALLPLSEDPDAAAPIYQERIHAMPARVEAAWRAEFAAKLALPDDAETLALIRDILQRMQDYGLDFTTTFRRIADGAPQPEQLWDPLERHEKRLRDLGIAPDAARRTMQSVTPAIIPRNHQVQRALDHAETGDLAPAERLIRALAHPFALKDTDQDLARPPNEDERVTATFCGT